MKQFSYSRVSTYDMCKLKWFFNYIVKPEKTADDFRVNHPLYLGILLEDIVKDGLNVASENYYNNYPIINNEHVNEVLKANHFALQIKELLKGYKSLEFEKEIATEQFIGYVDCLAENEDGTFDIIDFKYSNYHKNYEKSPQIHLYKYFIENSENIKIRKIMYFVAPKPYYKKDWEKTDEENRELMLNKIRKYSVKVLDIEYNEQNALDFLDKVDEISEFHDEIVEKGNYEVIDRNKDYHCSFCDYREMCDRIKDL